MATNNNNGTVTFYIKPTINEKSSMPQKTSKNYFSIESYQLVADPREGREGEQVWIRLKEDEASIFTDEQTSPFSLNDIKFGRERQPSIPFDERGRKVVSLREKKLLQFLRTCRENVLNADKCNYSGSQIFEHNPQAAEKKQGEAFAKDNSLRMSIQKMTADKAKAIYRIMGGRTIEQMDELDMETIKHNLYVVAKKDEATFKELRQDPYLETKYDIYEALDRQVIYRSPQKPNMFMWKVTNSTIKTYPLGVDAVSAFAKDLVDNEPETLFIIRKNLGKVEEKSQAQSAIEDKVSEVIITAKENSDTGFPLEKKGVGHFFFVDDDGHEYGTWKGYSEAREALLANPDLLVAVVNRMNNGNKTEE